MKDHTTGRRRFDAFALGWNAPVKRVPVGRWVCCVLMMLGLTMSLPSIGGAGGLFLSEIATNDVGLAGAGWAARGQDASTLFRNPAGMSLLEGNQAMFGAQILYGDVKFTNGGSSAFLGTQSSGNPVDVFPAASGFYTHKIGQDFTVGFGVLSNFGLGLKYTPGWTGRYYGQEALLAGVSFVPAASYRINDKISVGGGLNIMVAELKDITAINNGPLGNGDGSIRLQDVTAGVGGFVGVMVEPQKGTRFGVTYYSPIKLNFGATPSYNNVAPGVNAALNARGLVGNNIDLGVTVPQRVLVSVFHEVTDRLAVMGDFGWDNWSQFGKVDVSVNDTETSLTTNIPYQDTYHTGIGGQYRLNPDWRVNMGFGYDSSMVKDQNRTVTLPLGATYRYGLGAEWQATEKYNIGMNYELMWLGDMPVNQTATLPGSVFSRGNLAGSFNNTAFHWFAFNVRF
jgi:long-chain fatty acid transport protein